VFGADGAYSTVRKHFISLYDFSYTQEYFDYGYLEFEVPPTSDGKFIFHENSLHVWPRLKFTMLAMPNYDRSFTCNLFIPLKGENSFEQLSNEEDLYNFMMQEFPDAAIHMKNIRQTIISGKRGRLADIKCFPWHFHNFCLIGDAAHAVFPFFG
jgi:kynurenine 3-monooxygenase